MKKIMIYDTTSNKKVIDTMNFIIANRLVVKYDKILIRVRDKNNSISIYLSKIDGKSNDFMITVYGINKKPIYHYPASLGIFYIPLKDIQIEDIVSYVVNYISSRVAKYDKSKEYEYNYDPRLVSYI